MRTEIHNTPAVCVPADQSRDSVVAFEARLKKLLLQSPNVIVLDCSQLRHVSSGHISVLWRAQQICLDAGVRALLQSACPGLIRVLRTLDLFELFTSDDLSFRPQLRKAVRLQSGSLADVYVDEFAVDGKSIAKALDSFVQYLQRIEVPQETEYELRTVFYEVAINIQTHGQVSEGDLIVFTARADESKITLVFADSGIPFDPTKHGNGLTLIQAARNGQERGFGLMMVRKLSDQMSYVRVVNAINVLTLIKEWRH